MEVENRWVSQPEEAVWDEDLVAELLNSLILVGLTFVDREDQLLEQQQFWGRIVRIDRNAGFQIELRGTRAGQEDYWLPPDTRPFERAAPGEYRLRSTEEIVVNPDFTATWTITKGGQ